MSKAVNKEFTRTIRHSLGRFLAIAIISFLGAGVFAGLRMSAPDLRDSADEYFDATNMYDAMVVSTLGLDDESLSTLKSIQGVKAAMPGYSMDAMVSFGDESYAASVQSLPATASASDTSDGAHALSDDESYLNRPLLMEGQWPKEANECVVGLQQASGLGISIGDALHIDRTQDDSIDAFAVDSLTVTGFVLASPFCADVELGATQLGSGIIDLYLYVPTAAFNPDLPYTTIYVTVEGASDAHWGSAGYDDVVDPVVERIRDASAGITHDRNEALRREAQGELDDAWDTYRQEKADAEQQLSDARDELSNAHDELKDAERQLGDARAQLLDAQHQLMDSKAKLDDGEKSYAEGAAQLQANREQYASALSALPQLRAQREQLAQDPNTPASVLAQLDAQIQQLEQLDAQLAQGAASLSASRTQLDEGWKQYNEGLAEYERNLADYEKAVREYEEGRESYTSGLDEFEQQEQDARNEFDDAERELNDAQADIDNLEPTEVFVADRTKNVGAASREHDAQSIQQIATYLPFVFILVAVLVVLTSMTRMVDEERMVIGTHKALGYGKGRIAARYLAYGALASGIGSVVGVVVMGKLLPWFILSSYAINYSIPFMPLAIYPLIAAEAIGITVGVALIATWAAVAASLHEKPAALLLPRTPKAGKRILLERIKPIWRHISFSHKVTARNLFRYKPRFFMAVIGVAGCTALLVVGFGMRDVIGDIVTNQYEELITYDALVTMADDDADAEGAGNDSGSDSDAASQSTAESESMQIDSERAALRQALEDKRTARLFGQKGIESFLYVHDDNMIASSGDEDLRIEVIVPSEVDEFGSYITLRDRITHDPIELTPDSVVLSEKTATELGVGVGDTLTLYDENLVADKMGEGYEFTVGGITENYLQHYVYMTPQLYEQVMGEAPEYSAVLINFTPDANGSEIADALLGSSAVASVSLMSDRIERYVEMLEIMNKLIVVILLLAAALAFVVLYNLTNININERVREIATLKVLGFTQREVGMYIFREVFIMVLIGAVVGCAIGLPLTLYIAEAAETASMMFGRAIAPTSFVFSFLITLAFAILIAIFMRPKLAKINMVESLKSVE